MSDNIDFVEEKEKIALGILGAFLLSLIGSLLWVGCYWIDIFPPLCGFATMVFALIGYRLFAKSGSVKSVVFSLLFAIVAVFIGAYFCLAVDVYDAYASWFEAGTVDHAITFWQAISGAYQFLADPSVFSFFIKQLGFGALFSILGSVLFFIDSIRIYNAQKEY